MEEGQTEPDRQHLYLFYSTTPVKRISAIIALSNRPLMAIAIVDHGSPWLGFSLSLRGHSSSTKVNLGEGEPQCNGMYRRRHHWCPLRRGRSPHKNEKSILNGYLLPC
jgi:hypothetical protein